MDGGDCNKYLDEIIKETDDDEKLKKLITTQLIRTEIINTTNMIAILDENRLYKAFEESKSEYNNKESNEVDFEDKVFYIKILIITAILIGSIYILWAICICCICKNKLTKTHPEDISVHNKNVTVQYRENTANV